MINSRTKGAAAEREVFALISECLGIKVERNLVQTRDGGYDTAVGGWALEVKRQEILHLPDWWRQCCEQAKNAELKPMLIYRKSGRLSLIWLAGLGSQKREISIFPSASKNPMLSRRVLKNHPNG